MALITSGCVSYRPTTGVTGNGDIHAIEAHAAPPWVHPDDDGPF